VSLTGWLDLLATPCNDGALPDDVHKPCGIAMVIAVATRLAMRADQFSLPEAVGDDAYAAHEVSAMFEQVQPPLAIVTADRNGDSIYALDMILNNTVQRLQAAMEQMRTNRAGGGKIGKAGSSHMRQLMQESLHALYYQGIALCQDVAGLPPTHDPHAGEHASDFGTSDRLNTPLDELLRTWAIAGGLGVTESVVPLIRATNRQQRQRALLRVMTSVENWARTNTYNGAIVTYPTPTSCSVDEILQGAMAAGEEAAPAAALPTKSRKKKARDTPPVPQSVSAALSSRSARRRATEAAVIDGAIADVLNKQEMKRRCELSERFHETMNGTALNEATGKLGEVLQLGLCFGMTRSFNVQTFLFGPVSFQQCCTCPRRLHVVETVCFAGYHGACPNCGSPRCLKCVDRDMEAPTQPKRCTKCCAAK